MMPELLRQLENDEPAFKSVRKNAIWAVGEISIRWNRENMEKYIESILRALIPLIHLQSQTADLQENAVSTIGRLGIHNAERIAHLLPRFCRAWLYRARGMHENGEKDSAFQGFCKTVRIFPQALNEVVTYNNLFFFRIIQVLCLFTVAYFRQFVPCLISLGSGNLHQINSNYCLKR